MVICDEPEYLDDFEDVILNPKVIVEALSDSTEAIDRGIKFARCQKYNPTLTDHVLVSQDRLQLEHYHREKNGKWTYQIHEEMKAVGQIESIKCRLRAVEIYRRVVFKKSVDE